MGVSNPLNSGSDPKWSFGSLPALLLWIAIKPLSGNRFWSSSSFSTKYQTLCQRFSLVGRGKIISGWICWNSYNLLFQPLPSTIYPLSYKWGIQVKLPTVCPFEIQYFIIYAMPAIASSEWFQIWSPSSMSIPMLPLFWNDFTWHRHCLPVSWKLQTGVGTFDTIYSHMQVSDCLFSSR